MVTKSTTDKGSSDPKGRLVTAKLERERSGDLDFWRKVVPPPGWNVDYVAEGPHGPVVRFSHIDPDTGDVAYVSRRGLSTRYVNFPQWRIAARKGKMAEALADADASYARDIASSAAEAFGKLRVPPLRVVRKAQGYPEPSVVGPGEYERSELIGVLRNKDLIQISPIPTTGAESWPVPENLPLYHGTRSQFDKIKDHTSLTADKEVAVRFAVDGAESDEYVAGESGVSLGRQPGDEDGDPRIVEVRVDLPKGAPYTYRTRTKLHALLTDTVYDPATNRILLLSEDGTYWPRVLVTHATSLEANKEVTDAGYDAYITDEYSTPFPIDADKRDLYRDSDQPGLIGELVLLDSDRAVIVGDYRCDEEELGSECFEYFDIIEPDQSVTYSNSNSNALVVPAVADIKARLEKCEDMSGWDKEKIIEWRDRADRIIPAVLSEAGPGLVLPDGTAYVSIGENGELLAHSGDTLRSVTSSKRSGSQEQRVRIGRQERSNILPISRADGNNKKTPLDQQAGVVISSGSDGWNALSMVDKQSIVLAVNSSLRERAVANMILRRMERDDVVVAVAAAAVCQRLQDMLLAHRPRAYVVTPPEGMSPLPRKRGRKGRLDGEADSGKAEPINLRGTASFG